MAQMSKKVREMGGEVYVDAERVKKSSEALGRRRTDPRVVILGLACPRT